MPTFNQLVRKGLSTTADLYAHLEYAAKEQNARVISQMLL